MAINPKCRRCGNELQDAAAVLLGTPDMLESGFSEVSHLCHICYLAVLGSIDNYMPSELLGGKNG